ncbi:uncharacterized protein LOC131243551 isoform X2 [Magnolia sinica]|nr:uncharacterized protein LOC131243551 isoform X2 [Magnolia sinica]
MAQSSSPPSPMSSSLTGETDVAPNKRSISASESTWMPVYGGSANVKGYSLEDGGCFTDIKLKSLTRNDSSLGLSLQHSDVTVTASAGEEISSKRKLIMEEKSACQRSTENIELQLTLNDPFREEKSMPGYQSAFQKVSGNSDSLLSLGQPFGQSIEGQSSRGSCQDEEKLYQYSQLLDESCSDVHHDKLKNLALIEEEHDIQNECSFAESNSNSTHLLANRLRWDLNTMMETWEGSMSSSAINHTADGTGMLGSGSIRDKEPVICPAETILGEPKGTYATSAKQALVGSEDSIRLSCSSLFPEKDSDFKAPLRIQLNPSPSYLPSFRQGAASNTTKLNSVTGSSNLNSSANLTPPADNMKSVDFKCVKSEPLEGDGQVANKKVVNQRTPKPEPSDGGGQVGLQTVQGSNMKFIVSGAVKSEPLEESRREIPKAVEGISCQSEHHSELPVSGELSQEATEDVVKGLGLVSESVRPNLKELLLADQMEEIAQVTTSEVSNPKSSKSISTDSLHVDSCMNNGVAKGYEDKETNKTADTQEDDPGKCDHESDASHDVKGPINTVGKRQKDDNDYEDGEVRDLLVHNTIEGIGVGDAGEAGHSNSSKDDHSRGNGDDRATVSSRTKGIDSKTDNPGEKTNAHCIAEHDSDLINKKIDEDKSTGPCLHASLATEVPTAASGKKRSTKAIRKVPRDCTGRKDGLKNLETASSQVVSASQHPVTDDVQVDTVSRRENVKVSNRAEASHSNLPKRKPAVASQEAVKDVHGRSNSSRIINLPRARDESPSARTRSIPGRSSPLQAGKARFPDKSDKLNHQRDESCMDGFRKFERERNQDQPIGKSEADFMHGRRQIDNSLDALGGGSDPNWDYASEHCSSSTDFQFPRPKKATAFAAMMRERDDFVIAPDGAIVSAARARGKPLSDDMQFFHHLTSRRRSPGGRDGPMPLDVQMARRSMRDIGRDRCIGGGGTDMVMLRKPGGRGGPMPLDVRMLHSPMRDISPERRISGGGTDMIVLGHPGGREGPMPLGMRMPRRSMRDISPDRYGSDMIFLRRQSARREGPMPPGVKMAHMPLRDISPDRCIGGGGPDRVVLKHEEKFVRGLPDMMHPSFPRPEPQRIPNPFAQRERSLSPMQMRGPLRVPRIGSKSPPRSRTRSPDGRSELMNCRLTRNLRIERMRVPPEHPCIAEDMMIRRHGSPPYASRLSNAVRDAGPSKEQDLPRPLLRRSPSGRVVQRINRRFDMIDPRERAEGDEHLGPLYSDRLFEFVGDDCLDERRKFSERHGPFRPCRPHDVVADGDGLVYHAEGGSRRRAFPEGAAEFHERGDSRDVDGRIKYRLGNPRRPRSIEEQEHDYGHGGPGCHDPSYDLVRLKKRRN